MPVRKIKDEDLNQINNWFKNEFNTRYGENDFSSTLVYSDKELIGFINYSLIYDRAEINYIFVDENYRKKNIGTILFEEMLKEIGDVSISLEVKVTNDAAIEFYKKNGFKIVALREKYYQGIDGYLMVRE